MCYGCWGKAGKPSGPITDEITKAARLADAVYEYSCVGSNLHILLDDWNVRDTDIAWLDGPDGVRKNYHEATSSQLEGELECLNAFKALTKKQRIIALAIHQKFI